MLFSEMLMGLCEGAADEGGPTKRIFYFADEGNPLMVKYLMEEDWKKNTCLPIPKVTYCLMFCVCVFTLSIVEKVLPHL